MPKAGIDQEAIVMMFSQATAQQGEAHRKPLQQFVSQGASLRETQLKGAQSFPNEV